MSTIVLRRDAATAAVRGTRRRPLLARLQKRLFYLGRLSGSWGRSHPAMPDFSKHLKAQTDPQVPLERDSWKRLWDGQGPLYHKLDGDKDRDGKDEMRCWQRYLRQQAESEEWQRMDAQKKRRGDYRQPSKSEALDELARMDRDRKLWLSRFDKEEVWPSRCPLDWARMTDDTVYRLMLWDIYGPPRGRVSPPTTPIDEYEQELRDDCMARGESSLAMLRNREIWARAMYFLMDLKKEQQREALLTPTEPWASSPDRQRDTMSKLESYVEIWRQKAQVSRPEDLWSPFHGLRAMLYWANDPESGGFKIPAPPEDCTPPPEAWKVFTKLSRYIRGDIPMKWIHSREAWVARQRGELKIKGAMANVLSTRLQAHTLSDAVKDDIRTQEQQLEAFEKDKGESKYREDDWENVQIQMHAQRNSSDILALQAIPVGDAAEPRRADKNDVTTQDALTDIICDPLIKKALVFGGPGEETGSAAMVRHYAYEVARHQAKARGHHVHSGQYDEYNKQVARFKRRLDIATGAVRDDPSNENHFVDELRTPDHGDALFRPDRFTSNLDNVRVYDFHRQPGVATPATPADASPGVKM